MAKGCCERKLSTRPSVAGKHGEGAQPHAAAAAGQASMRVAKGLDKGQEKHRCTARVARGKPSFPGGPRSPLPVPARCWGNLRRCCLLGDSSGAAGVRGLLNGGSAALLVAAVLGEGGGEGEGGGRDVKVGQECN